MGATSQVLSKKETQVSVSDRQFLTQLSLIKSELARYLRTSRQAVCSGIKKEKDYLNLDCLLKLYDALHTNGDDIRANLVANRLKKQYGLEVNPTVLTPTIDGSPDSFPQGFKEMWVFAEKPLELTCPTYTHQMLKHFQSAEKTLLYFVSNREISDRLAHGIRMATGLFRQNSQKYAEVYILLCNAVMFMPHFVIFDPISSKAKGYVRVAKGFVQMDQVLTGRLVVNFTVAGVRPYGSGGEILADDTGFDGVSFKILHKI